MLVFNFRAIFIDGWDFNVLGFLEEGGIVVGWGVEEKEISGR